MTDDTLKGVRDRLASTTPKQTGYYLKDGITFRRYFPTSDDRFVDQLVVPNAHTRLLALAHDIPLAGHMGIDKTRDRVTAHRCQTVLPDMPGMPEVGT